MTKFSSPFGRQVLAVRFIVLFFVFWFIFDHIFTVYPSLTLLLSACFALPGLLPRPLTGKQLLCARRVVWALGAPLSLLTVELLNNTNPFDALTVEQGLLNLVWYYLIFGLLWLLLGRVRRSAAIAAVFFFAIGLVNHYVLTFRGRVIFPCDLVAWRTALNVADGFSYAPDETIIRAACFALAYLVLLVCLPAEKQAARPRRKVILGICTGTVLYCALFFGTPMLTWIGIYAQQWKTQSNGFVLNFTAALRYSVVTKPDGYSPEAVQQIIDSVPDSAETAADGVKPVHILAIMNESFADLSAYDLPLSADPTPFLHSLTKNTINGTMYSPVTGGGTANVEFEFLTGDSLAFLPSATVAYQLYLREHTPSLVSQVTPLGYKTTAFHPYHASGWNRTSVYDWMGFDDQLYEDDVSAPSYIRTFISDTSDYEKLYQLTDEAGENPLFVFNVTIQNHSGYQLPWANLERTVELTGNMQGKYPAADQFFSLMRASDDALRALITHYEQSNEPTMIIFFGDHQPPLGNDFYEAISGKPLDKRTTEETFQQYGTPFFIWTNYDIDEAQDVNLSPWGLGVLAAQTANLPLTGYQKFLSGVMARIPVITPVGFITADGRYSSPKEENLTGEERYLVQQYRLLAYNNLFGGKDRADAFFFPEE